MVHTARFGSIHPSGTSLSYHSDQGYVDLFAEDEKAKENFLSLYNALHGTNLQLSCPVENIRLDNVRKIILKLRF